MVLGSKLGSISSGKAKKIWQRKSMAASVRGASHVKPPCTANHVARGVADHHAFLKKIVDWHGGAPRSFTGSGVPGLIFCFFGLARGNF